MLNKIKTTLNQKGPTIARYVFMGCFLIEFILSIVILSGNSSSPSVAMTVPRIFAALLAGLFAFCLIKKLLPERYHSLIIKALAGLSLLVRALTLALLKYYTRNPTE